MRFSKPYQEDLEPGRKQAKRAPPLVMKEFNKEIELILDHQTMGMNRKNQRTDYLVHWKDNAQTEASWEQDVPMAVWECYSDQQVV